MHIYYNSIDISTPLILAVMATVGYVFGSLRQRRRLGCDEVLIRLQRDLFRAKMAVHDLGKVVHTIRNSTSKHYARLKKFHARIAKAGAHPGSADWQELCREVEGILDPTFQLVSEIAIAQERIRYQGNYLMTFSEIRTDPLTGVGNRRALDYIMSTQFNVLKRYGTPFSLAVVDIDGFKEFNDQHGHQHGDQVLRDLANLLTGSVRTADIVARYGGDEFVAVLPHTDLPGAELLGERLRAEIQQRMPFTVSVGLATANRSETAESLFHRADEALYRAKTEGRNRICCHQGETDEPMPELAEAAALEQAVDAAPQEATAPT
jgi:diguanylate cyclase